MVKTDPILVAFFLCFLTITKLLIQGIDMIDWFSTPVACHSLSYCLSAICWCIGTSLEEVSFGGWQWSTCMWWGSGGNLLSLRSNQEATYLYLLCIIQYLVDGRHVLPHWLVGWKFPLINWEFKNLWGWSWAVHEVVICQVWLSVSPGGVKDIFTA